MKYHADRAVKTLVGFAFDCDRDNSVAISSLDGEVGVPWFATQIIEANLMLRNGTFNDNVDEVWVESEKLLDFCRHTRSV